MENSTDRIGRVYWLTGLSGAGKSTLGRLLYNYLVSQGKNSIHLDGDELREIFGMEQGYSEADRLHLAERYSRICKMISRQGIDVVCTTVSMFEEVRSWNRDNIPDYVEIYVKASLPVLIERDQKGLYSSALCGETQNVVGVDLGFQEPASPDIVVINDGDSAPEKVASIMIQQIGKLTDER